MSLVYNWQYNGCCFFFFLLYLIMRITSVPFFALSSSSKLSIDIYPMVSPANNPPKVNKTTIMNESLNKDL